MATRRISRLPDHPSHDDDGPTYANSILNVLRSISADMNCREDTSNRLSSHRDFCVTCFEIEASGLAD